MTLENDTFIIRQCELEAKLDDLNRAYDAQVHVVKAQMHRIKRLERSLRDLRDKMDEILIEEGLI